MSRRPASIVLTALLAITLSACGDDDLMGGAADTTGGGDATLPTSVGNVPGLSSECEAYLDLSLAMTSALTGGFDGFQRDVVSDLPPEIQADGSVVVEALQEFSDGLDELGIDMSQGMTGLSAEQMQAFGDLGDSVFTDDVDEAFDRLGEFADANCSAGADF